MEQVKTVLEVIRSTTAYFERAGVESARLNIEHLLAHVLGKRRMEIYLEFDRPLQEDELAPLREMVRRRADGVPLQHLLGTVEFCGREFACDARALIPRPETELLVELCLSMQPGARLIAEPCTGSGVIAISLAAALPQAVVHATDVSSEALTLAQENAARHGLLDRVNFHESDLLDCCDSARAFDMIVCNPPYVTTAEIQHLSREVRHDPLIALNGGEDGLDVIRRLVVTTSERLTSDGLFAIEIGHNQADDVMKLLNEANMKNVSEHLDYAKIRRFVTARHG